MGLPGNHLLEFYRGDSLRMRCVVWADKAKTQPADLTGATAAAEIRPAPYADPSASLTCAITDNVIDVSLSAAQSLEVPAWAYWDLQITYASGDVQTVVAGGVRVTGDITRMAPGARGRAVIHA